VEGGSRRWAQFAGRFGRPRLLARSGSRQRRRASVGLRCQDGHAAHGIEYSRTPFTNPFGVGPRATPTVNGDHVFSLGVTGHLGFFALEKADSGLKFTFPVHVKLHEEYKLKNLTFGPSASPLIEGDLVIVQAGGDLLAGPKGKGAGILAFHRTTGKLVWKATDDPASYSSPIAIGDGKSRQIVVLTQLGVVGLSPQDGKVSWQYSFKDAINESSTSPLQVGDLLIISSVTRGSVALKHVTDKDGKPGVEEVWKKPELSCYFSTPVAVGKDHLYMANGSILKPSITLRCVETATGKTLWSKQNIGKYHAALVKIATISADARRRRPPDPAAAEPQGIPGTGQEQSLRRPWAHPALSNGRIYLRDAKELICLELEK